MEILAPAGSPESLEAAVRAGADAVYLGAGRFSARAGAKNFSDEDLASAVKYCHARNVKVYLAINTLLLDGELPQALRLAEYACSLPVDAVLVQDMGLLRALRSAAPELRLHASTQTGVHTACGAAALLNAGFRRVVLARELSLREIAQIHASCPIELEAFVHGALCMSVSGQCYFSSVLGSRSGNRGMCAQPCRLPFSAPGGTGHDLSLKDLSMVTRLEELERSGICSAKIEGRLKRPEYVAAASRACRLAADGQPVPEHLTKSLRAVFSRSGFTTGYFDGRRGREMFGVRSREDAAAASTEVLAGLREIVSEEKPSIPVDFILKIQYNKPIRLTVSDAEGHTVQVTGPAAEAAQKAETGAALCEQQLRKTGGTPFYVQSVSCELPGGIRVPVSALNHLRREALSQLEALRAQREPIPFFPEELPHESTSRPSGSLRIRARFMNAELPETAKQCDLVYLPYHLGPRRFAELLENGFPAAAELPRGLFGLEDAVRRALRELKSAGVKDVWAGNLDGVQLALEEGFRVHGGFSLNIANTQALEWYRELGLADAELSFELKLSQACRLGGSLPRGLILHGRLPMMLCRNCPAANSPKGCLHCRTAPSLTDRRGVQFPVQCYGACSEVLNSVPLSMLDRLAEVRADFGLLRFSTETAREADEILAAYFTALRGEPVKMEEKVFTRGLYYRGME